MAIKYNDQENKALDEKENNPNKKVICPRCGKELQYRDFGNSYEVKCPTEGCLKSVFRGI